MQIQESETSTESLQLSLLDSLFWLSSQVFSHVKSLVLCFYGNLDICFGLF